MEQTPEAMREHAETVGPGDLFNLLVKLDRIEDDDLGESIWDGYESAYDRCLPHIQSVWAALGMGDDEVESFEVNSNVEEMFAAIFRTAFELGWLAGAPTPPSPTSRT